MSASPEPPRIRRAPRRRRDRAAPGAGAGVEWLVLALAVLPFVHFAALPPES
ncbi:MAG: hypothetical protein AB7O97_10855 [Planctomycetota bacterium]